MHLILMTRGIQQSRDLWRKFMETQWFDWKRQPILKDDNNNFLRNPDGSLKRGADQFSRVQGALRPIELWEYVFPQESLQEVLAMMNMHKSYNNLRPEVKNYAWILRKLTGAKKIPDMPELQKKEPWEITQKSIPMNGMCAYPIGIREDVTQDFTWDEGTRNAVGFHQEGL